MLACIHIVTRLTMCLYQLITYLHAQNTRCTKHPTHAHCNIHMCTCTQSTRDISKCICYVDCAAMCHYTLCVHECADCMCFKVFRIATMCSASNSQLAQTSNSGPSHLRPSDRKLDFQTQPQHVQLPSLGSSKLVPMLCLINIWLHDFEIVAPIGSTCAGGLVFDFLNCGSS